MALAKLWNALFGKKAVATESAPNAASLLSIPPSRERTLAPSSPNVTGKPVPAVTHASKAIAKKAVTDFVKSESAEQPVVKLSRKKTKNRDAKVVIPAVATVAPTPTPVLRLFRRKTNAWTKLLGNSSVGTILDTNVGDGSRALEILESIVDSNTPAPRYVAIGLFESAGEALNVRQFHQKIRSAGGQPIVIPMTLTEGLRRVSQTIGAVDLVLLDVDTTVIEEETLVKLLARVTHPGSIVLRKDQSGRWANTPSVRRKAA